MGERRARRRPRVRGLIYLHPAYSTVLYVEHGPGVILRSDCRLRGEAGGAPARGKLTHSVGGRRSVLKRGTRRGRAETAAAPFLRPRRGSRRHVCESRNASTGRRRHRGRHRGRCRGPRRGRRWVVAEGGRRSADGRPKGQIGCGAGVLPAAWRLAVESGAFQSVTKLPAC